jgi:hypothetical protein
MLLEHVILLSVFETLKLQGQLALLNNPEFQARLKQFIQKSLPGSKMEEGSDNENLLFFQTIDGIGQQEESNPVTAGTTSSSETDIVAATSNGLDWLTKALKDPRSILPSASTVADFPQLLCWSQVGVWLKARTRRKAHHVEGKTAVRGQAHPRSRVRSPD